MWIALDARTIYRPTRRGTGKNLVDLYGHLAKSRPGWRVLAYHRMKGRPPLLFRGHVEPRAIEMPGDRFDAWERLRLPLAAWRDGAGVLHCPANTCPAWMPLPTVVTIHDLIPLDMPEGRNTAEVRRFEQAIVTACRRAAWIITPSSYTRDRLVHDFSADARRITVNPWAPDSTMRRVEHDECLPVLAKYGVRGPFVLHLGAAAVRKNTRRVLQAWSMLAPAQRRNWQLLVVGLDDATRAELMKTLDGSLADSVKLHGFADEADMPALMSAAEMLAYPSLSEGFGLPLLDAWAAGTAVLTSDRTSLPEVAGDAAVLVDPADPAAISHGLSQLMNDPARRDDLIDRGRQRLRRYSWNQTIERFARVMEIAAGVERRRLAA